ncbi:MAG: imidazolonepropionase, partial [Sphingobacterium siyangense]
MMEKELKLVGPFRQVLTLSNMPVNGALHDKQLAIIKEGGILIAGNHILEVGDFEQLQLQWGKEAALVLVEGDQVALPGF